MHSPIINGPSMLLLPKLPFIYRLQNLVQPLDLLGTRIVEKIVQIKLGQTSTRFSPLINKENKNVSPSYQLFIYIINTKIES